MIRPAHLILLDIIIPTILDEVHKLWSTSSRSLFQPLSSEYSPLDRKLIQFVGKKSLLKWKEMNVTLSNYCIFPGALVFEVTGHSIAVSWSRPPVQRAVSNRTGPLIPKLPGYPLLFSRYSNHISFRATTLWGASASSLHQSEGRHKVVLVPAHVLTNNTEKSACRVSMFIIRRNRILRGMLLHRFTNKLHIVPLI